MGDADDPDMALDQVFESSSLEADCRIEGRRGPTPAAVRHLATLRVLYPDAFVAGGVFHTGPRTRRLGDRLVPAPVSAFWN
jgi:hypothetical protein